MAGQLDIRPSATTFDVETLVQMAWRGQIRVPHFQRDFRWRQEDVRRLFDSIVRGYPIGSLLLWVRPAPAQQLHLGTLRIDAPDADQALWVVDGQQRVTSLANALHEAGQSDPRFALAYNLDSEQFVAPPAVEDPSAIPLPVLFDLQRILRWFAQHPEISEFLDRATGITKSLRQYPVPAYQVAHDDASVLQDIFDRMNNYGKRLSRSEIFSALNAGEESRSDETLTFKRIAEHVEADLGFGVIDNDTVLKAVLARRGPDVMREIRNEFVEADRASSGGPVRRAEFPGEGRDEAYQAGEEALARAVAFLQERAGVPHVSMLPYRYLLVVLARLFAHHPEPDARNLQLLRRWYWRAAVAGPAHFKGNATGAVRALCYRVLPTDLSGSVQGLLDAVSQRDPKPPDLRRFRANEASTKIALCAWWDAGPFNLETCRPYERAELSERLVDRATAGDAVRYVVARFLVPAEYRLWAADRVLMPILEGDFIEISGLVVRRPHGVDDTVWATALRSHSITPELAALLVDNAVVDFLQARQTLLEQDLRHFLNRMCEWELEDTPPLSYLMLDDEEDENELV
ncbi:MAG TPA: DUF262 domain-containing protein [Mycobacteriales bacterium]|nr:DUF262 domain-containing protein [Mycobacteriales bacterium]